jgi:hypothetical protein
MKFNTRSGSVYQVDTKNKQVRRLVGVFDPTPRQGADGQFRKFVDIVPNPIEVGKSVVFVWELEDTPLLKETIEEFGADVVAMPTTITSPVVSIDSSETI